MDLDTRGIVQICGWLLFIIPIRFLGFFRQFQTLGPIIAMISAIMKDIIPFVILMVVIIVGGGMAMPIMMDLYHDQRAAKYDKEFQGIAASIMTLCVT